MIKKAFASFYLLAGLLLFAGCGTETAEPTSIIEDEASTAEVEVEQVEKKPAKEVEKEVEEKVGVTADKKVALSKMSVHYIDVGQADATLLEFSDGDDAYSMLIDTGDWNSSEVVSYLHAQDIKDIDIIAITHPHADHIGQLSLILNEFNVAEVWMNGETTNSMVFSKALETIEEKGVDYYEPEVGDVFDIGPLEVAVLHPGNLSGGTNDNSIAMRLQYGGISFLFTGDGELQAESDLLASGATLSADILHLGHHGSDTSTSSRFLEAVHPKVAIYSAGIDNSYGHPHAEVINRVQTFGAELYGTDVDGTIIVETDGTTFNVLTQKDGTVSPGSSTEVETKTEPEKETPPVSTGSCVNINTASEADIQGIMHIGPARAKDLIQLRPFASVNDLSRIKGIGPARIDDIIAQGIACTGG
ncbi:MBL fold metallo-hydrolase [Filibacter tadaridae]|uniref:ComEC family competence protein n=1 Tax=Filibacter tadaridae TaxID=2483811 RepID=A0A3P5X280_9BACL|nr:MBL fold metallo-hydrolase [Filibacter tadaridae]VDC28227.1 ComEC family competence protein [Filibacter tadaridae]